MCLLCTLSVCAKKEAKLPCKAHFPLIMLVIPMLLMSVQMFCMLTCFYSHDLCCMQGQVVALYSYSVWKPTHGVLLAAGGVKYGPTSACGIMSYCRGDAHILEVVNLWNKTSKPVSRIAEIFLSFCFQAPHQPGQPGFKFTVAESCDRIKDEFQFLQAQYHR